jgi:hypothetical protein
LAPAALPRPQWDHAAALLPTCRQGWVTDMTDMTAKRSIGTHFWHCWQWWCWSAHSKHTCSSS